MKITTINVGKLSFNSELSVVVFALGYLTAIIVVLATDSLFWTTVGSTKLFDTSREYKVRTQDESAPFFVLRHGDTMMRWCGGADCISNRTTINSYSTFLWYHGVTASRITQKYLSTNKSVQRQTAGLRPRQGRTALRFYCQRYASSHACSHSGQWRRPRLIEPGKWGSPW